MDNIQYSVDTRAVHKQFIDWANGLLSTYTTGIWDDAIRNVLVAAFIQKTVVFLQEMYSLDGRTLKGYLMVTDADTTYRALYFDYAAGYPVYYCNNGLEEMMELNDGVVKQFYTNTETTFHGSQDVKLVLTYEFVFGIKMPMATLLTPSGEFIAKGALDMIYDLRTSGTYSAEILPLDEISIIELTNKTKSVLTFELPILPGFSVKYVIKPNQTVVVPRTKSSEYFIRTSFEQNSMIYRFL
jgi:hypothetical protein